MAYSDLPIIQAKRNQLNDLINTLTNNLKSVDTEIETFMIVNAEGGFKVEGVVDGKDKSSEVTTTPASQAALSDMIELSINTILTTAKDSANNFNYSA